MEAFLIYLLKSMGISSIFLLCYEIFLKKDTFFAYNRWFLFTGLLTSLCLPMLTFTKTVIADPILANYEVTNNTVNSLTSIQSFNPYFFLGLIYLTGVVILTVKLCLQLISLKRLISKGRITKEGLINKVETEQNTSPFSFFNYVVFNPKNYDLSQLSIILAHEKIHIKQRHSLDIIMSHLIVIFQWFNPFIWRYKSAVEQNLEFIADAGSAELHSTKKEYQHLLVKSNIHYPLITIGNSFYNSLIKKRIVMLNKTESPKINMAKYSLILPLLLAFTLLFNVKTVAQDKPLKEAVEVNEDSNDNPLIKIRSTGPQEKNTPLYIIDGKESSEKVLQNLNPDSVESIFVLKDDSATKKYGEKGENGVVLISLKKNKDSQLKVIGYADSNPLIIMDGKESTKAKMEKLDPDKIESMNVIKGEQAFQKYGKKAKDGVIEITTKKD